jgi:hypothetical protein
MGMSVLDWACECCRNSFNLAMSEVGLGDGTQYERDERKVCITCASPDHQYPCGINIEQLKLDQPNFKLPNGQSPTRAE